MLQTDVFVLRPAMVNQRVTSRPQTRPSKRLWRVNTLLVSLWDVPGGLRCSSTSRGAFVAAELFHVGTRLCLPPWQVRPVVVAASVEIFQAMATPQPDQQRPHTPQPSALNPQPSLLTPPTNTPSCCRLYSHSGGNPPELRREPLNFPGDASRKYTLVIPEDETQGNIEEELSDQLLDLGRNTG